MSVDVFNAENNGNLPSARKLYVAPTIVEYGTMRDVTLSRGTKGNTDGAPGGQGSNNKTSI